MKITNILLTLVFVTSFSSFVPVSAHQTCGQKVDQAIDYSKNKLDEAKDNASKKAHEAKENFKDKADQAQENVEDAALEAGNHVRHKYNRAVEKIDDKLNK